MADRYFVPGGTNSFSLTSNWSASPTLTPTGASVPGSGDNAFFTSATTYTVISASGPTVFDFNVSAGTVTFNLTGSTTILGSFNVSTPISWSGSNITIQANSATTRTIRCGGSTIEANVTVADGGFGNTYQLVDNFVCGTSRTFTYSGGGTLDLNGFTLTCGLFNSSNSTTRTIAFGTSKIICTGSGNVWNLATITGLTITGTPQVDLTYSGLTNITISLGALPEASSVSFAIKAGGYGLSFGGTTVKNLDFTGFAGSVTSAALTIYGNVTLSTSAMSWSTTGTQTFAATSGTQLITSNGRTFDTSININSVGVTVKLADAMTTGSSRTLTLTTGTFDLNNQTATVGFFNANNSNTRTIAFGTGNFSLSAAGGTPWNTSTITGLTVTGTPVVNYPYTGATLTVISPGTLSEANSISFNFTGGTYALTLTAGHSFRSLNFVNSGTTGYGGALGTVATDRNIYGSITFSSNMTMGTSTLGFVFKATSGTQTLTMNGITLAQQTAINNPGATLFLADAVTIVSTRSFGLINGSIDGNNKTISGGTFVQMLTGSVTMKNLSTAMTFTHSSGTLTQIGNNTTGPYTLTAGTLDLGSYQLNCTTFDSNNVNTRTLAFGTGNITCTATSGTVWTTATVTALTITGTPVVNVTSSGLSAITVAAGVLTEAQSISFNFTGGTYTLTYSGSGNNMNFTSFGGAFLLGAASTIYGNWTIPTGSTMTTSASAVLCTFGATSGTKTIKTSGVALNFPVTFNGAGGTWQLQDNLTVGSSTTVSTRTTSHTQGTLDLNNFQLISGLWNGGSGLTRTLAFGTSGSVKVIGSGSIIQNNLCTTAAAFSYTGTSLFYISNNSATASTIAVGAPTEAVSMNYLVDVGTYAITMFSGGSAVKNLDFTGFSGTFSGAWNALSVYGNLTFSATAGAPAASGNLVTFRATSGTQLFTSNGKTLDFPITVNGVGGTVKLADALTMGATRALTLTNGTFDGNSKTISGASSFTMVTGSVTAKNISTALAFTHTSGTLTQGANNSIGAYTITAGTLDLAGFTFTTTSFVTAVGTKNLTFNGGTLTVTDATTTAFNNAQPTGFTTTAGTGTGKISMTAATAKTFVGGGSTFNCTLSNDGAGALTISGSNTFTTIANGVQPTAFTFTSSTTQTVTNWTVSGIAGNLVTITSTVAGTAATLSKASGTVSSDYLSLKDSAATGGATWYAGANSTNVSGNSGWIFTAPPVITAGGNFFFMF